MPKGSNYLNNNKGVFLQASTKKKEQMPMCHYGAGCNNPQCIYRHPTAKDPSYFHQSKEPCMAFLAGDCAFDAKGCRKRHPPKEEAAQLIARYKRTQCRFGDDCQTRGCLYQHPSDEAVPPPVAVAPQQVAQWGNPRAASSSSWRFQPPTSHLILEQQQQQPNHPSSSSSYSYYYNNPPPHGHHYRPPPSQNLYPPRQQHNATTTASAAAPILPNPGAKAFVPQANAKEFVPGNWKKQEQS